MSKWMILATHAGDEITDGTGGILAQLKINLDKKKIELETHERPYVLYIAVSDFENEENAFVKYNKLIREIYEVSQLLKFNYNILFTGREYYNRLNSVPVSTFNKKLRREINFIKPEWLFIPNSNFSFDASYINKIINNSLFCDSTYYTAFNVLEYGNMNYNFFVDINREVVDLKEKAYRLYKSLVKNKGLGSWDSLYYKLSLTGTKIGKEYAEGFKVINIRNSNILDTNGLEYLNIDNKLELKEIL